VIQQTNGDNVEANWHRSENNKKLRLENFALIKSTEVKQ